MWGIIAAVVGGAVILSAIGMGQKPSTSCLLMRIHCSQRPDCHTPRVAESVLTGKGDTAQPEGPKKTELLGNRQGKSGGEGKSTSGEAGGATSAGPRPRQFSTSARGFAASAARVVRRMPR